MSTIEPEACSIPRPDSPVHSKLGGYDFYRAIGSPKYVVAPMVDQSELPYRMLTRRYGAQLCYTPMLHSRMMVKTELYRQEMFTTCEQDRPLVTQLCGDDPDTLLAAARFVEDRCDAIDLNLGCPQGIARRGHYGSFLLDEPELVLRIVRHLHKHLRIPITCKIRILPTLEKTLWFCRELQAAGCQLLTVHGRLRGEKKQQIGPCRWDWIRAIKRELTIPVFANGGMGTMEDVRRCLAETGVDGVMSSEAVLENPAFFAGNVCPRTGRRVYQEDLAREYVQLALEHPVPVRMVRAHLFKLLFGGLQAHTDLRGRLATLSRHSATAMDDMVAVVEAMVERLRPLREADEATGATALTADAAAGAPAAAFPPSADGNEVDHARCTLPGHGYYGAVWYRRHRARILADAVDAAAAEAVAPEVAQGGGAPDAADEPAPDADEPECCEGGASAVGLASLLDVSA